MKYEVNGVLYDDFDEAKKEEIKYLKEKAKKEASDAECERRKQEVLDAYDKYHDLYDAFKKDYPNYIPKYNWNDFFRSVFDV